MVYPSFPRSLRFLLALALLLAGWAAHAQDNVYVYGTVKDYTTSKKLDGVTVTVFKDGTKFSSVVTSANGKYEFNLDYGYEYKLEYTKVGMVSKNVTINTRSIPDEDRAGGLAMNVEMTLFANIPGIDFSVLQQPIGKSKYDPGTHMLAWDLQYTEQMRAELDRLQKEYDEKKKREAGADADFAKLMDQGNAAMGAKDYKKAVQSFTDALGIKAGDAIATAKLSDAKIKLGEQAQADAAQKQYTDLIKEADALFGKKSYADAKTKYAAASEVKENEAYPKQKIKECDAFIADLAAKAEADKKAKEIEDKYNAAIKAADAAFSAAKYDEAKGKYNEALGVKPKEKYPTDQLAAIEKKLAELAAKAEADKKAKELEDKYNAAIKAADAAFNAAKYDEAKGKYNEALGVKPKEKYPTDQLAAIDKKLAELAAKADADKKAAEQDAAYQAAIKAADAAFNAAKYDEAKGKYNEALGVKPKEKYPTDQLAAIDKKLAELAAKADADKKAAEQDAAYQVAIKAADAAFNAAKYDEAKGKYNEALGVKPKEKYPTDQLAAIEKKLAELAAKADADKKAAEQDAAYQAAIKAADAAFNTEDYDLAKGKYNEALKVKPAEKYPAAQLAAIDKKLADQAAKAASDAKAKEREAKYQGVLRQAEDLFTAEKYEDAKGKFQEALGLKPDEAHPKERIVEIDAKLADLARRAEELRKSAKLDDQYKGLLASADKKFDAKKHNDALKDYTEASRLKPGEQYPKDRIAAINALLAEQAAADSLKAAQEAAEKARLQADAQGKAEAAAALNARYDAAIAKADQAFQAKSYTQAKEGYAEALSIKPAEKYPKDQLAAIEKALADQIAAGKAAADAAERQRLADEERRRREAAAADSAQAAQDQALRARESQKALDERYAKAILDADKAMGNKDYPSAKDLYSQALDIKPKESYPQVKLDQIEKLLAEAERQRKEREAAAQQPEEASQRSTANTLDNRKEQEAEVFMREAREREEAEKYEKIKRFKAAVQQESDEDGTKAVARQEVDYRKNQAVAGTSAELYQGSEAMRKRNAAELEAFRQAWAQREKELQDQGVKRSEAALDSTAASQARQQEQFAGLRDQRYKKAQEVGQEAQAWAGQMDGFAQAGARRTDAAGTKLQEEAKQAGAIQSRGNALAEKERQQVDRQKELNEAHAKQMASGAHDRIEGEVNRIGKIEPNQPRSYADYNRNKLASQYPQGVTEESYTEGNKVIIRRVVVQGNKADEYSKVIAKWGTFYFKNGQSISEQIWSVNTGN